MREPKDFKIRPSQLFKIMGAGKGDLPVTCQTYLIEWYADEYEDITSKYMTKGILKENDAIDFMATTLSFGIAEKNEKIFSNDFCVGTPDVIIDDLVIDLKCSWNKKTLHQSSLKLNKDYEWQLRAYMWLTGCTDAILFYALMDTPAEANYGKEILFEHLPTKERFVAYKFSRNAAIEEQIKERVLECRKWVENYEKELKERIGKVNEY